MAAVCDVFEGQPYHDPNVYTVDPGTGGHAGRVTLPGGSAGRLAPPAGGGTPSLPSGLCEMRRWSAGG